MDDVSRYCDPPFRITRMSHVCLAVSDLEASTRFYQEIAGLVVTEQDDEAVYLRGIEEICHHSLVLRATTDGGTCDVIGYRVQRDEDLDLAKDHFDRLGETAEWTSRPGQRRTLAVRHSSGIPFELVCRMEVQQRMLGEYPSHRGAGARRIDHCQVLIPDVDAAAGKFMDMGFRASHIIKGEDGRFTTALLHRKNNPHDLVLVHGAGPRLHHFTFVIQDNESMLKACDIAGYMGYGRDVERGPGKHGPGMGTFVYFRDPDGHRLEIMPPPLQYMDIDETTRMWNAADRHLIVPWGQPAPKRWREEASLFTGIALSAEGDMARWAAE